MPGLMDNLFQTVQDFSAKVINALIEKFHLQEFYERHKIVFIAGLSSILFIIFLSVILLVVNPSKKKEDILEPLILELDQDFVLPEEPSMNEVYYLSRLKTETWSPQEVDRWFTVPDENMVNQLSIENNRLIKNLLEASP